LGSSSRRRDNFTQLQRCLFQLEIELQSLSVLNGYFFYLGSVTNHAASNAVGATRECNLVFPFFIGGGSVSGPDTDDVSHDKRFSGGRNLPVDDGFGLSGKYVSRQRQTSDEERFLHGD